MGKQADHIVAVLEKTLSDEAFQANRDKGAVSRAFRAVAADFGVNESTIRDKCTRKLNFSTDEFYNAVVGFADERNNDLADKFTPGEVAILRKLLTEFQMAVSAKSLEGFVPQQANTSCQSGPAAIGESIYVNNDILTIRGSVNQVTNDTIKQFHGYKSVLMQDGVTAIDDSAFWECESIVTVSMPDSLIDIGDEAFYGCKSLREVIIPCNTVKIGYNAFGGCDKAIILCKSGSAAETFALDNWMKFKLTDRAQYAPAQSSKPLPDNDGRFCGAPCFNISFGHYYDKIAVDAEYSGWYFTLIYDKCAGFLHLVSFDEDNIQAIRFIWKMEMDLSQCEFTYDRKILANRYGLFLFIGAEVLQISYLGQLVHRINIGSLVPKFAAFMKKDPNEWKKSNPFRAVWAYGQTVYFTTEFDNDQGLIYRLDMETCGIQSYKIRKPRNSDEFYIDRLYGDDRWLYLKAPYPWVLFDVRTEETHKMNAYYIDFETKRCFYEPGEKPVFTPEGFANQELTPEVFGPQGGFKGKFYSDSIFTGCAYYGFRYRHNELYTLAGAEDHYYNLYMAAEGGWIFLNAGSRDGIEELRILGNYAYFNDELGLRAKLNASGMRKWRKEFETTFKKLILQENGD